MAKAAAKKSKVEETATRAVTVVKSNPNTLLIVLAVAAGGYVLYKVNQGVNTVGDAFTNSSGGSTLKEDLKLPPSSLSVLQAQLKANKLYDAFQANSWGLPGTDTEAVYNELRGLSHNDYVKVFEAFGKKSYNPITGEGSIGFSKLDLTEWLTAELSNSEFAKLRQILPNVF
ncbi:hypothetical protein ACFSYG_11900 [Leeuwenhoekiella polynyae]|uniref:Uncharacterized protein n=1 Tax=Leeuwenhoekiella polynyae TaxID=1550906 RepID=A0A4Q0PFU4_9FLAO|nr:hypothetical protein [Leeuwenhoekiella polynyae]RXG25701.1 hypothetical protein DSM02_868 [Leeuwenhoekiella polynyae]